MHREVDLVRQPKAGDRKGPPFPTSSTLAPTDGDALFLRLMLITANSSAVDPTTIGGMVTRGQKRRRHMP